VSALRQGNRGILALRRCHTSQMPTAGMVLAPAAEVALVTSTQQGSANPSEFS